MKQVFIKGKTAKEVFKELGLKEHTLYEVKVKARESNPEHQSYLFVGFESGGYCVAYVNNYEYPIDMMRLHSIKVVKELSNIKP